MPEPQPPVWNAWAPEPSDAEFPAHIANIELHTTTVDADSELTTELLQNPLPYLKRHLAGVNDNWQVVLTRINAQRPTAGPRKMIIVWTVFRELEMIHGLAYRAPNSEAIPS
jgi:hypothetical protein